MFLLRLETQGSVKKVQVQPMSAGDCWSVVTEAGGSRHGDKNDPRLLTKFKAPCYRNGQGRGGGGLGVQGEEDLEIEKMKKLERCKERGFGSLGR
jgi:hypothetical protein